MSAQTMADDYDRWTKEQLIQHVKFLEAQISQNGPTKVIEITPNPETAAPAQSSTSTELQPDPAVPKRKQPKKKKQIDPSKYTTRFIALKLAYQGKNYNGFEYQKTAVKATIEEELWKALVKSCLIFPEKPDEVNFAPWEYSKCGRTDRGVSAFGQVVNIRVRSNRPKPKEVEPAVASEAAPSGDGDVQTGDTEEGRTNESENRTAEETKVVEPEWDPIKDEIDYCRILNGILPPDIRILAWCPNLPPEFNARFSCRERQYRYFFAQPAYSPWPSSTSVPQTPATVRDGWLDIDAMKKAAKLFEGLHDFRNFCKVDPKKQISNYWRRIFECDIVEVKDIGSALPYLEGQQFRPESLPNGPHPKVYYFHVRGSAFLWHQIRHMVAVIFAVGQGFEQPSIVSDLLDVEKTPRRPGYSMAEEIPLVLWDCIFPDLSGEPQADMHSSAVPHFEHKDAMDWVWMGEDRLSNLHGSHGLADHLWEQWRGKKIDEILANQLLEAVVTKPDLSRRLLGPERLRQSDRVFEGGNSGRFVGNYQPITQKPYLPSPDEANDKYAQSLGYPNSAEMTKVKNWRTVSKAAKESNGTPKAEAPESMMDG